MLNVDDVVFNDFGPTWTFLQLTRFFLLHVAFIIFCVSRAAQSAVCHSLHGRNVKTPPLSCHNSLQANFIITLELWIAKRQTVMIDSKPCRKLWNTNSRPSIGQGSMKYRWLELYNFHTFYNLCLNLYLRLLLRQWVPSSCPGTAGRWSGIRTIWLCIVSRCCQPQLHHYACRSWSRRSMESMASMCSYLVKIGISLWKSAQFDC